MPTKKVSQILSKDTPISYTDKPVTAFGGLALVARFFRKIGLADILISVLPDTKTSNNSIPAVSIALSFLVEVLKGARRFAHAANLRFDRPIKKAFGISRPPSASVITRYFGSLRQIHSDGIWDALVPMVLSRIKPAAHTLDLDSTVMVRYGEQEGSAKGYNPKKPGRNSHHPLMAFLPEVKMILHAWLRPGNTSSAKGVVAFLKECSAFLTQQGHSIGAVRADSGFFEDTFLSDLELREITYAVVAKFNSRVKHAVGYTVADWHPLVTGIDVGETVYQAAGWKHPRRMIVVRELKAERPKAMGRKLFDFPDYRFRAIVTSIDLAPEEVWRFYNGRADSENRIKEVCEQYGAKGFSVKKFFGTEVAFRLICFLFNLMAIFKRDILKTPKIMIDRLRLWFLAVGGILGMESGKPLLRLSLSLKGRERFDGYLERLSIYDSTALQLEPMGAGN